MAVVINDFEVLAEEAPPAAEAAAEFNQPAEGGTTPHEIELINRRQHERAARVRAD